MNSRICMHIIMSVFSVLRFSKHPDSYSSIQLQKCGIYISYSIYEIKYLPVYQFVFELVFCFVLKWYQHVSIKCIGPAFFNRS